jgi:hypothetical protein
MDYLRMIWSDIRKGENIELIITIVIAIIAALLQYFVQDFNRYLPGITLAILAMLATAMLVNRYHLERLLGSNQILSSGIKNVHDELPTQVLDDYYRKAKEEICVLWTWSSRIDPLQAGLLDAAKSGVKVRILLLQLDSEIASYRLIDQGFQPDSARPKVGFEGVLNEICANGLQKSIQIRFYDALPPFTLYKADDKLVMGIFWHGMGSSNGPHIEIHGLTTNFGKYGMDTFEKIWKRSTPVPL